MSRRATIQILLVLLLSHGFGAASDHWALTDVNGKQHNPFETSQTKALVLVFIGTDCPIANSYQPALTRLATEYMDRGFPWFLVHSDPDLSAAAAAEHAGKYQIAAPVVLDQDQGLARRAGARFTPEAVVVGTTGEILYRGRIDNTYEAFGKKRARATLHELRDALDAILAGRAIENPTAPVVGCHIWFAPRP